MALINDLWDEYQHLTPHQKHVVFAMYWHGYTAPETAETIGLSLRTVERALATAEKKLKNKLENLAGFVPRKGLVPLKAENDGDAHGNGLVPTKAQSANKAPVSSGPPPSACPPPDIYLGSPARDAFIKELSWCAASPFLQLQGRGGYNERARANRERIHRDREEREAERRALQAA